MPTDTGVHVLCLDVGRGRGEGGGDEGDEKIVATFGRERGQLSAEAGRRRLLAEAGLVEGLLSFTASFDRLDEACTSEAAAVVSDVTVADMKDDVWVIVRLSLHPNIIICIMVDRRIVSRHVTDRNVKGLGRLVDDMASLVVPTPVVDARLAELVRHVGKVLSDPLSWVRRQLRNPFALTHGASMVPLPGEVVEGLRDVVSLHGVNVGLWRGGLCCFSSWPDSFTGMLGSFVLGDGATLVHALDGTTRTRAEIAVDGRDVLVVREGEHVVFVGRFPDRQEEREEREEESQRLVAREAVRVVTEFVASAGGWPGVDAATRHVAGSRYCVCLHDSPIVSSCSPRTKVSSSSHHARSVATTLADSIGPGCSSESSSIYTCDKTGHTWGCYRDDGPGATTSLSVTIGGLSVLDVNGTRIAHEACQARSRR
mgnify:CR=1 FL=1